jgi:hypothetical protein
VPTVAKLGSALTVGGCVGGGRNGAWCWPPHKLVARQSCGRHLLHTPGWLHNHYGCSYPGPRLPPARTTPPPPHPTHTHPAPQVSAVGRTAAQRLGAQLVASHARYIAAARVVCGTAASAGAKSTGELEKQRMGSRRKLTCGVGLLCLGQSTACSQHADLMHLLWA